MVNLSGNSSNNLFAPPKTVNLQLVGLDGNAFSLMGAFSRQARKEGWSKDEIDIVLGNCMRGDYDHLLCVLMDHCEISDEDEWPDDEPGDIDLYERQS